MSAANPIKLTLVAGTLLLAAGCSSRADIEQEAFEIANQSLRTLNDEQGNKLFSFLVTVKAESKALLNKQGRYSKQELKKLFSTDSRLNYSLKSWQKKTTAAVIIKLKRLFGVITAFA
jgi:hypothetical protein